MMDTTDSDSRHAIETLAESIARAHRHIALIILLVAVIVIFIGFGIAINGCNAVEAGNKAEDVAVALPKAKKDATQAATEEATRVATRTRTLFRRQTRIIVRRELGRRGATGLMGRPPTSQEIDDSVARRCSQTVCAL